MEILHAGPIRLKFADGEMRYLMVGDQEIARRVYVAIRDGEWDTIMPNLTACEVHKQAQGFTIDIKAECRRGDIDYRWQGHIVGTPEGKLTFHVKGKSYSDFSSNRMGICVLYGSGALAGQSFVTTHPDGSTTQSEFPNEIASKLVADHYTTLSYTTPLGLEVTAHMAGPTFEMEDQRNYADTSYKAYAPLVYPYPKIPAGVEAEQTLTLEVRHVPAAHPKDHNVASRPIVVNVGKTGAEGKVPKVVTGVDPSQPCLDFSSVNFSRAQYTGAKSLTWGLCPTVHLWDDDNIMDNLSAMPDQVRTAHTFAPDAPILISPVRLDLPHPRPDRDPRNTTAFGAAWSAAALKYLALAGVEQAAFEIGPGPSVKVQEAIGAYTGQTLREIKITHVGPARVEAFLIQGDSPSLWLVNLTAQPQHTLLLQVPSHGAGSLVRFHGTGDPVKEAVSASKDDLAVVLAPFEVVELRP